jgi:malate dehydrogenase (oxaloacetate-decarboxylating)(NADP+)
VDLARERWSDLKIDGEMHADIALDPERRASRFGFAEIKGEANVLIFPNLDSAHISTRLMGTIGGETVIGPILMGMRSPVNSLKPTDTVDDTVNLTAIRCCRPRRECDSASGARLPPFEKC